MNKLGLVIQREFLTRIRKKAFIIMTILGPFLIGGGLILTVWLSIQENQKQKVLVVDESMEIFPRLENNQLVEFDYAGVSLQQAKALLIESNYTAILYLPSNIIRANTAKFYVTKMPGAVVQRSIEKQIEKRIEHIKLKINKIDPEVFYKINTSFNLSPYKIKSSGGEELMESGNAQVGFAFGLLIYMFIFLYSAQVMRSVIEEKTNRIVEIIISSVKPFQLMMGKIIANGLLGLTQFVIWAIISLLFFMVAQEFYFNDLMDPSALDGLQGSSQLMQELQNEKMLNSPQVYSLHDLLSRINFGIMIGMFLFYFFGGYLLYSSLFAAIGSAVDNETDSQQFMLPLTIPLTLSYVVSAMIINNPDGPAAFWFSIVPLTSPIVMMVRLAIGVGEGGVPYWEIALSMFLLIVTFIFTTFIASKIYRIGILSYGKKPSFKLLFKWAISKD